MESPDTEGIVNQAFERALDNNEREVDSRTDQGNFLFYFFNCVAPVDKELGCGEQLIVFLRGVPIFVNYQERKIEKMKYIFGLWRDYEFDYDKFGTYKVIENCA